MKEIDTNSFKAQAIFPNGPTTITAAPSRETSTSGLEREAVRGAREGIHK